MVITQGLKSEFLVTQGYGVPPAGGIPARIAVRVDVVRAAS
jgi:hypothetical protein